MVDDRRSVSSLINHQPSGLFRLEDLRTAGIEAAEVDLRDVVAQGDHAPSLDALRDRAEAEGDGGLGEELGVVVTVAQTAMDVPGEDSGDLVLLQQREKAGAGLRLNVPVVP